MRLYRVSEVADILRVTKQTVYNWIRGGKIKAVRLPSGSLRIPESEVKRILSEITDNV
ncbi:MAG: helix-turn-helix domain-containing protein [Armatimonadetes bacterium]|nr:helix-turn-helix domain-containing protein [Armatimonadota bacterium]